MRNITLLPRRIFAFVARDTVGEFAMVFKRGDPFRIFLGAGSALFSGVFFRTQLLKTYAGSKLSNISLILPTTHGLDGIRQVLIEGHEFAQVTQPLLVLLGFWSSCFPSAYGYSGALSEVLNAQEVSSNIRHDNRKASVGTL